MIDPNRDRFPTPYHLTLTCRGQVSGPTAVTATQQQHMDRLRQHIQFDPSCDTVKLPWASPIAAASRLEERISCLYRK